MESASGAPAPEDLIEQQQHEAILRDAILALPTRCRQVYLLSRMEGLSYKQIANRCGISVKTVEKHITQALTRLCAAGSGRSEERREGKAWGSTWRSRWSPYH